MYCTTCGTQNAAGALSCAKCGAGLSAAVPPVQAPPYSPTQAPPYMPQQSSSDPLSTLIPYKNSYALIAYYLAVFSLIPGLGLFLGIAAFFLGLKGLKYAKATPEAKGKAHAWAGIILGGLCGFGSVIGIVVLIVMSQMHH